MVARTGNRVVPTMTVTPARIQIFQPTQRPVERANVMAETSWGRCRVTGRLGQRHADLLEALLYNAEEHRETDDGGIELLVDPARVRKTLSDSWYSWSGIQKLLVELRAATVQIETPLTKQTGIPVIGGLLDYTEPSSLKCHNPLTRGERPLMRVKLGRVLTFLLGHDLHLYVNPAPIVRLCHGISQAIARHIQTHKTQPPGGWHLDGLIVMVGGTEKNNSERMRRHRCNVRKDEAGLAAIGIVLDGDRVKRVKDGEPCSTRPVACSTRPISCSTRPKRAAGARPVQDISGPSVLYQREGP
jgi:hypothetical protein